MAILNFGSINIDFVYQVEHIVRPGQTIPSESLHLFAGGKGANQSVALVRAGAEVFHAGCVGADGQWVVDKLASQGVDTSLVEILTDRDARTGHAVIQVEKASQNAILVLGGANHQIQRKQMDTVLASFGQRDLLLLQNEINDVAYMVQAGRRRGMTVCLNPAPMTEAAMTYPYDGVDLLIVNEAEGQALSFEEEPKAMATALLERFGGEVVVTCGAKGVLYGTGEQRITVPAVTVDPVDTTAAGDTFIGFFLAARAEDKTVVDALTWAVRAAAISVTRPGAMDSIPTRNEI